MKFPETFYGEAHSRQISARGPGRQREEGWPMWMCVRAVITAVP